VRAAYRFHVAFRLDPGSVSVDPDRFETTMRRPADPPGESGWLFFRDNLWRGEVGDPGHLRDLAGAELGVEVTAVEFRAFECDAEYRAALEEAIAANLGEFRADSAREVLHKYLGSRLEVRDRGADGNEDGDRGGGGVGSGTGTGTGTPRSDDGGGRDTDGAE
jgi:hypothetical protein